jgi:signal transduction histidine kinase
MTEAAGTTPPDTAQRPARRTWAITVTVLAVATSIFSSLTYYVFESTAPGTDDFLFSVRATLGFLAAIGAAVALVWRHQRPMLVTGIAVAPPLLLVADTLAALIALAALAATRRDRVVWAAAGLVFAATMLTTWRDARRDPELSVVQIAFGPQDGTEAIDVPLIGVLLIAAALTAVSLAVGLWRGARRDLAHRQWSEHELRTDLARQDERSRIAREMHDVLGHRLSLLSLHAGALEVSDDVDRSTAEAARTIRATARECLDDLRQVIGVLRNGQAVYQPDGADREAARPQPTLTDVPDLISASRQSGLDINVTVLVDEATTAPPALGTAAYRIIQEALTNALRHAAGTTVDLTVRGAPNVGVKIEVVNPLPGGAPVPHVGSGTGLIGITERVATLGGKVSTGPTDNRTFAVNAWLPWPHVS